MDDTKLSIITKHMHYGCDEAGRGCLNGPVVVASVLLGHADIPALNDSKKLTEKSRNKLFDEIMEKADDVSVVEISPKEIDELNILKASLYGMRLSWEKSRQRSGILLVDGNKVPDMNGLNVSACHAIVKGDGRVPAISAASIIAKVTRDRLLEDMDKIYPEMQYAKHKCYGTALHLKLMREHGINDTYRMSFNPVKEVLAYRNGVQPTSGEQVSLF